MRGIKADLMKYSQAATFNQALTSISDEILIMVSETASICHLISECDYPQQLVVTEYLGPQLKRNKTDKHLSTLMAKWMINTWGVTSIGTERYSNKVSY